MRYLNMRKLVQVDPFAYLFAALLLLVLPLDWCICAFAAAAFHEFCHLLVLWYFGGKLRWVKVGIGGAEICAELDGQVRNLLSILAGPAGSYLLLLFCHRFPKLALCAGIQGTFNLLPLLPLDGGRALECVLKILHIERSERVLGFAEWGTKLLVIVLAFTFSSRYSMGVLPVFIGCVWIIKGMLRKRPCKRR